MELNTHNAEILLSAANKSHYPQDELPEIALAGRSNVGKSSFINTMLNRKNLARTSGKPGKTQLLNFFNIDDKMRFVDVPGYGYARVSKKEREKWGRMIESLGTPQSCAPTFHVPSWKRGHSHNQAHPQSASCHQC